MPRAFLITNKRYNSSGEHDIEAGSQAQNTYICREESPERRVSTAEEPIGDDIAKSLSREDSHATHAHIKPASPKSPASLSRGPLVGLLLESPIRIANGSPVSTSHSPHMSLLSRDSSPVSSYHEEEQLQPLGLIVPKSRDYDHQSVISQSTSPVVSHQESRPTSLQTISNQRSVNSQSIRHTSVIRNLSTQFRALARSQTTSYPAPSPAVHHLPATLPSSSYHRVPLFHHQATALSVSTSNPQFSTDTSNESSGNNSDSGDCSASSASGSSLGPGQDAHVCPECGKRYSTSSNLARHRQTHRSVTDKKARKCPHCEKVYVSIPAYSMHVRTHSQGCQCPYCGKCFSRPWLLQGHIRTHTGEKPFKCPICAKAFADKSNLRAHVQTHSTTKPYVCQRCGKAFALKSYLYKHEESSCMRLHRQHRNVRLETSMPRAVTSAPMTLQIQA